MKRLQRKFPGGISCLREDNLSTSPLPFHGWKTVFPLTLYTVMRDRVPEGSNNVKNGSF